MEAILYLALFFSGWIAPFIVGWGVICLCAKLEEIQDRHLKRVEEKRKNQARTKAKI